MIEAAAKPRSTLMLVRAPIANETERAHFQRRLSFALLLTFVLAFGFWLIALFMHPFAGNGSITRMFTGTTSIAQLATTFSALVGFFIVRRRSFSIPFLDAADAVAMIAICWGWDFMATSDTAARRPELVGMLAVTYTLVTRAAFVPSTTIRTMLIATVGIAPIIPGTFLMYARDPVSMAVNNESFATGPTVFITIWSMLCVACTSTISYVIYGLRLQVRQAMHLGQYVLEDKIGEGGMGVVYRASHAMLRRPTAIKLLTNTTGHAALRFEREVQITARLTHPNTVAVYDYGRTPEGVFYYAMEFLDGITLDDLVHKYGPQPPHRVAHLLVQICGALEEAHRANLVHRDIKPANVMLTERGGMKDVVKVLDFGLVKESAEASTSSLGTSSLNAVMGTPHFMAPEAILDPPSVDGRTDLYSLGVTAYFLLTGERVFEGSNLVEICSMHLHQAPVAPSKKQANIPEALERVVLQLLAKKQEERPASAADVAVQLCALGLPAWSRKEADAWWATAEELPANALSVVKQKKARRSSTTGLAAGATVTVALSDRDRAVS